MPKDKAKELIDKFNFSIHHFPKVYTIYQIPEESKRCALITVDEIINILEDEGFTFTEYHDKKTLEFWLEVKNEINNL